MEKQMIIWGVMLIFKAFFFGYDEILHSFIFFFFGGGEVNFRAFFLDIIYDEILHNSDAFIPRHEFIYFPEKHIVMYKLSSQKSTYGGGLV